MRSLTAGNLRYIPQADTQAPMPKPRHFCWLTFGVLYSNRGLSQSGQSGTRHGYPRLSQKEEDQRSKHLSIIPVLTHDSREAISPSREGIHKWRDLPQYSEPVLDGRGGHGKAQGDRSCLISKVLATDRIWSGGLDLVSQGVSASPQRSSALVHRMGASVIDRDSANRSSTTRATRRPHPSAEPCRPAPTHRSADRGEPARDGGQASGHLFPKQQQHRERFGGLQLQGRPPGATREAARSSRRTTGRL